MVPENDDESWQNVPYVNWNRDNAKVKLNANWRSNDNSNYSVPVLRESSSTARSAFGRSCFYPRDFIHPPNILPASCRRDSTSRY